MANIISAFFPRIDISFRHQLRIGSLDRSLTDFYVGSKFSFGREPVIFREPVCFDFFAQIAV